MFLLLLNRNEAGVGLPANSGRAGSKIPSTKYHNTGVMCCVTNAEGQECSQVYDYGN